MARRHPFLRADRNSMATRRAARGSLARFGHHAVLVALGFSVALGAWNGGGWNGPRAGLQLAGVAADPGPDTAAVGDSTSDVVVDRLDDVQGVTAAFVAGGPTAEPLRPLVRKVSEGDTLRAIAAEYSVSISTILASNRLDDPDLIRPGQELLIPPLDGLVADVEPGETLGRLAARLGADPTEIAQANALPPDLDRPIPYERLVVPGLEPAERVAGVRQPRPTPRSGDRAPGGMQGSPRPSGVTYEVQEGDTLVQLAAQFGVSAWTILTANDIADPDMLSAGTRLKVPPVNGVEHQIRPGESLSDIASYYGVGRAFLIDFNALADPDALQVGGTLTIPGADRAQPAASLASLRSAPAPAPAARPAIVQSAARPAAEAALAQAVPKPRSPARPQVASKAEPAAPARPAAGSQASSPARPAARTPAGPLSAAASATAQSPGPNRLTAAAATAPLAIPSVGGSAAIVTAAMAQLGARYVWGGTSPVGFDCSGFVWFAHKVGGRPVSRALEGQFGGGPRVTRDALQPGDTVFFENTYKPGLSHNGIYIGGGRFIHASDELSGVKISSLSETYWASRYVGARRLW